MFDALILQFNVDGSLWDAFTMTANITLTTCVELATHFNFHFSEELGEIMQCVPSNK